MRRRQVVAREREVVLAQAPRRHAGRDLQVALRRLFGELGQLRVEPELGRLRQLPAQPTTDQPARNFTPVLPKESRLVTPSSNAEHGDSLGPGNRLEKSRHKNTDPLDSSPDLVLAIHKRRFEA